jgi:hypothetical protein
VDDWIIADFTLKELKTLKLRVNKNGKLDMRLPWFDDKLSIPTFQEYLDFIKHSNTALFLISFKND